jgi:hypothetical protein
MSVTESSSSMLAHADMLRQAGRFKEAIAILSGACRQQPDAACERVLAQWRYEVYAVEPPRPTAPGFWPMSHDDPFTQVRGVPEIPASQLNPVTLAAGIQQHGALLVRGLVDSSKALQLASGVQQALDACEAWHRNGMGTSDSPWYARLGLPDDCDLAEARVWVEGANGVWAADSPRMLFELTELFGRCGVTEAIEGYFGERPMLSVGKSTLRRVPSTIRMADWHQDGAFMGSDIRSVNLWLSLSDCGHDASGLEFLPRRLSEVLPSGTHGAIFDWSVGPGMVEEVAKGEGTVSPVFAPGDALLFDHFFLHRTGIPAAIAKDRYAIESWFFAPSAYPVQQVPLWL